MCVFNLYIHTIRITRIDGCITCNAKHSRPWLTAAERGLIDAHMCASIRPPAEIADYQSTCTASFPDSTTGCGSHLKENKTHYSTAQLSVHIHTWQEIFSGSSRMQEYAFISQGRANSILLGCSHDGPPQSTRH